MGFTIYLLLYNCNGTLLTTPPGFHPGFRDITFFLEFFLSHLPRDTHKILLDFCSSLQELYTFWIFSSPSFEKLSKGLAAELPAFAGSHCSASLAPSRSASLSRGGAEDGSRAPTSPGRAQHGRLFDAIGKHHSGMEMFGDMTVRHPKAGVGSIQKHVHRVPGF